MTTPYSPALRPAELWDTLARENAVSAVCWHFTEQQFQAAGEHDANYFLSLLCRFGEPRKMTVLDLGGGLGRVARYLAPQVRRYLLLDCSAEMLTQADARLQAAGVREKVSLHLGDGTSLAPVGAEAVDFAFERMCFQHCDREVTLAYLAELWRVLRPGGVAWLEVPPMRYPERFAEAQRGDWPANFRRWSPGEFLEVLVRLGFSVLAADCEWLQVIVQKREALPLLPEFIPGEEVNEGGEAA